MGHMIIFNGLCLNGIIDLVQKSYVTTVATVGQFVLHF